MDDQSFLWAESSEAAGVRFRVRCMSFGRRLELMKRVGDSLARLEFMQAGEQTPEVVAEATTCESRNIAIHPQFLCS